MAAKAVITAASMSNFAWLIEAAVILLLLPASRSDKPLESAPGMALAAQTALPTQTAPGPSRKLTCDQPGCKLDHSLEALSSSVHTVETTVQRPMPWSYRDTLVESCSEEYQAADELYTALDSVDHRLRSFNLSCCRGTAYFAIHKVDRTVKIIGSACRQRWCPMCSDARSKVITHTLIDWLKPIRAPKLLTLTLLHSDDSLDKQITRLYACFKLLRRRKLLLDNIRTGVWFFQIKKSRKTDQWHPHLHVLMDSEYIPHGLLKAAWLAITGDSQIVDIRAIYNPDVAARYVARYAARPARLTEFSEVECHEIYYSLHGRRILGSWGDTVHLSLAPNTADVHGDYTDVGSFLKIRNRIKTSENARLLWKHYLTGEPLPLYAEIATFTQEFNPQFRIQLFSMPPPQVDPQLYMDFTQT